MRPLLTILARMKFLRGTMFDPFGRSSERRVERQLIAHYEKLVSEVLPHLSASNHQAAVALLDLADAVRGFGPVKQAAVANYNVRVAEARTAFESPSPLRAVAQ